jgi:micrococcal nuclease
VGYTPRSIYRLERPLGRFKWFFYGGGMSKPGHGGDCPYCLQLQREFPENNMAKNGPPGYAENWSDKDTWKYRPISYRVYDGDTILDLVLDLGFNVRVEIKTRLYGINAPEVRGSEKEEGFKTRDWLTEKMHDAQVSAKLFIQSHREQGKFGRWLVTVWADGVDLNKQMVEEGYARYQKY